SGLPTAANARRPAHPYRSRPPRDRGAPVPVRCPAAAEQRRTSGAGEPAARRAIISWRRHTMAVQERIDIDARDAGRAALPTLEPGGGFCLDEPITVEQFYDLIDEDSNLELVNGVITMAPPPSDPHQYLFGWLHAILRGFVEERQLGA